MPTYGTYTWNIIESLRESAVTLTQEGDTLHLQAEGIDIKLDSQGTLASRIMEQLKVEGLSWRDLAERLSTAATTLTNVRKNRRTAPWELAARIILLIGKLPTPEQADHMFMEMRLPGLYTDTYSAIINRRNHVIRRILEYGQSHPCPCSNWLEFTLCVMHRLDLPFCPEIRFHTPDLSSETLELIRQWQQEAAALRYCDYSKKRKLYLEAYREAHRMKGHGGLSEALQKISDDHYIGIGSVQHFFGSSSNTNTKCGRNTIICIAVALGCTVSQTNEMLRQADEAVLYANVADATEVEQIQKLLANGD